MHALIGEAIRAPSSHNTQPWLFRVDDAIELVADRTRALPVNDPFDRELTISCGAALLGLRIAAAARGLDCDVERCPVESDPDLLARVRLRQDRADPDLAALQPAQAERFTTRQAFRDETLPEGLPSALVAAAEAEGAQLELLDGDARDAVAALVAEGDRIQFGDPSWRRELAGWMHPRRAGDGLAVAAIAVPIARLVVRHFDLGRRVGDSDGRLARQAPLLAVFTTEGDEPGDWLAAGEALQRALLVAAGAGIQAGYLNQPCQVDRLRPRLADEVGPAGVPQVVVRMGVPAKRPSSSPRRPVEDVVLPAGKA